MKRKYMGLVIVWASLSMTGCTDTQRAGINAYGQKHRIKQFSCGKIIGEWVSTGKVENEDGSDGYRFKDQQTNKIVEISGTVQVTLE